METLTLRIHGEGIKAVKDFLKTLPPQFVEIIKDEEEGVSRAEAAAGLKKLLHKGISEETILPEEEADRISLEAKAFARRQQ
ncbi:MAG: hypothetical protein HQK60_16185 [Deltaproteobacteria bacterium]|nr:hypothetical protein [Deltaproteobacteria bacterium]